MYGGPQHDRHAHTDYSPSDSRFIYFLLSWVPAYNSRKINGSIIQQGMFAQSSLSYQWLYITGWWYTYPSEKYESQWEGSFPYIMEK